MPVAFYGTSCFGENCNPYLFRDRQLSAIILLLLLRRRRRRQRQRKRLWVAPFRQHRVKLGVHNALIPQLTDTEFKQFFRVSRAQFDEIHEYIRNDIEKEYTFFRAPIGTRERLSVCLRFLASGNSYTDLGFAYRLGESTISKIVKEVCEAIWRQMQPHYLPTPTAEFWKKRAIEFETQWHYPNCVSAIDGKHVWIRKPIRSGSEFYNYKQTFSIVLLAGADAHYRFTFCDIGTKGRFSDGYTFAHSAFGQNLLSNNLDLPPPCSITEEQIPMPYVFVADAAFPLMVNVMRPYPEPKTRNDLENRIFNYRLSRARQTIECAFGILAARFRVYRRPLEVKVTTVDLIVKATCVLHNYLCGNMTYKEDVNEIDAVDFEEPSDQFTDLQSSDAGRRPTRGAFEIREQFKKYFNSVTGSLPWQVQAVQRGKY